MRTTADFLGLMAYLFLMGGWALDEETQPVPQRRRARLSRAA